ncbi:1,6-anhydro-N-acetylmuramyl-L-alanine amidase AmpD [Janthinobacterium fluminis]|uniref:1,6-anhydro-N-acetylmuramyl-L-alanine amidase AmpD n=1 Tax=Janthinobacterium fluminis TaxID=2987524 RepID=A0ABT5K1X1_9BURK|nr:1,6-anhydro-N-acetylmuramyl-L-alanine amidase AmpD [Janthinobacterium fluminis]MDC8758721.1 1,6-anhydro-N-acetylmuramyl-L-alanine amidase AmpD [Janthinobacterium fluminis]
MRPDWTVAQDGWCAAALRYETPFCDARPAGTDIDLLVIHNVSLPAGQFGGPHVSDLFTGRLDYNADPAFAGLRGLEVSAHFFLRRDGRVIQYVSANDRAWHAGLSAFGGRERCNGFSIGIELEGSDFVAFTAMQYAALAALTAALQTRYRLLDVCGHEHIAAGRKTDPGPCFDWKLYKKTWEETLRKTPGLALTHRALRFPSGL